jgi:hypothetical protein
MFSLERESGDNGLAMASLWSYLCLHERSVE